MTRDALAELLAREPFVILDGGLATELERRGCDLDNALWSAKVLVEQPDLLGEVHEGWLRAGADIITTASYQATIPGLCARGLSEVEARAVLRSSVTIARAATEAVGRGLVAASLGSYGAYLADGSEFRGDYSRSVAALREFHRDRLIELSAAGPDLLAWETIPNAAEAVAIAELLTAIPGPRAWVSFSLRPELGATPRISDGTPLTEAVAPLIDHPRVAAIGVNCVAPKAVLPAIEALADQAATRRFEIIVYPNAGERWIDGAWSGSAIDLEAFTSAAERWHSAGARIIGGCCRTGPAHIEALTRIRSRRTSPRPR